MQKLQFLYQQKQVKDLEKEREIKQRYMKFKKESSQDKASRLIQLNSLRDKQRSDVRELLVH